jgi:DNA-binding response OmpR family regulator
MFEQYLRFSGHDVAVAPDGHDATGVAADLQPDAIVLGFGGRAAARVAGALKTGAATRRIPVIALTSPAARRMALRAGCEAVLGEPCYPDVLAAEIRRVIAGRQVSPPAA